MSNKTILSCTLAATLLSTVSVSAGCKKEHGATANCSTANAIGAYGQNDKKPHPASPE